MKMQILIKPERYANTKAINLRNRLAETLYRLDTLSNTPTSAEPDSFDVLKETLEDLEFEFCKLLIKRRSLRNKANLFRR